MVLEKLDTHVKKNDTALLPFTIHKNQIKMDLNIRPETMKLLEENIRVKLLGIDLGNDFLDLTKAIATKSKINKEKLHQT